MFSDSPIASPNGAALRQTISVVPQRAHLFSTMLRDNLLLALPGSSDEALVENSYRVDLKKLLEDAGLNSWLGRGGRQLSGGELCRLTTVCVLLHDASLVLLDEPTEGLDAATESQIFKLLAEVMHEKMVLMATHRPRGLPRLQQVVVMDNGQIIEQGTHAKLPARQGHYY